MGMEGLFPLTRDVQKNLGFTVVGLTCACPNVPILSLGVPINHTVHWQLSSAPRAWMRP